jgi:hypothetical protein
MIYGKSYIQRRVGLSVLLALCMSGVAAFAPQQQLRVPRFVSSTVVNAGGKRTVGTPVAPGQSLAERLQGKVAKPDGGRGERPRGPGEVEAARGVQLGEGKTGNATFWGITLGGLALAFAFAS